MGLIKAEIDKGWEADGCDASGTQGWQEVTNKAFVK
jgi:hypothetical protein